MPEFIDPRFRENKPKTLVCSHRKRAFWAWFRENWVYNFGHWSHWSSKKIKKLAASLFRPRTNPICHQKPNPSRETVPFKKRLFFHTKSKNLSYFSWVNRFLSKLLNCCKISVNLLSLCILAKSRQNKVPNVKSGLVATKKPDIEVCKDYLIQYLKDAFLDLIVALNNIIRKLS